MKLLIKPQRLTENIKSMQYNNAIKHNKIHKVKYYKNQLRFKPIKI